MKQKHTNMLYKRKLFERPRVKRKAPVPLRRPPRLKGEVAKLGIKPIRKKSRKK